MIYWEQRKLGECFTERIDSMPNGELISVTINDGIKKFSELGRHDNSNEDKSKYKKVCIGDIAYNSMRMWQGASGYSPYNGIVSPAYTVLVANEDVNSKCIAYQFKLPRMIHAFQINSQGITSDNWNLKFPTLSDISIYISRSIDEQGKIASLLESLDNLITLHQSKSFGHILKAIVSCTLSWEQRKFSELYELVNEKNDGSYGKDSNITVATMQFKSNIQISKNEYLNTYNIFKKGYIAFEGHKSKEFRFGRFVENDIGDGIVSHIFIVFRPIMEFDINFWKYAINNEVIMQSILSRATKASTMMNDLVVKDFLKEIFFLPSLGEQACIGKTLKSIDHLITLHQLEPFQLIFKAIAYRIIDYAKSKPPRHTKYEITISFIKCYVLKLRIYAIYLHIFLENIVYQGYNTVDEKYVYMQNYNIK